jgi:hypothetical protein
MLRGARSSARAQAEAAGRGAAAAVAFPRGANLLVVEAAAGQAVR